MNNKQTTNNEQQTTRSSWSIAVGQKVFCLIARTLHYVLPKRYLLVFTVTVSGQLSK